MKYLKLIQKIACAICRATGGHPVELELPLPTSTREVTANKLASIFRKRFPEGALYLSDYAGYKLCNLEDINIFLEADQTDKIKYQAETFDCDNFARRLFGQFSVPGWSDLAIGKMWTDKHACLIVIDENEDLWILEPQTDALNSKLEFWQGSVNRWTEI